MRWRCWVEVPENQIQLGSRYDTNARRFSTPMRHWLNKNVQGCHKYAILVIEDGSIKDRRAHIVGDWGGWTDVICFTRERDAVLFKIFWG